ELMLELLVRRFHVSPLFPVPMRQQHGRQASLTPRWPIQAACHEMPGQAFEVHLLDGVALPSDRAVNDRVERRGVGHGPQSERHLELSSQLGGPRLPRIRRGDRLEEELAVQVLQRRKASICRDRRRWRARRLRKNTRPACCCEGKDEDQHAMSLRALEAAKASHLSVPSSISRRYVARARSYAASASALSPALNWPFFWSQHWSTALRHHCALRREGRIGFPATSTQMGFV